MRRSANGIGQAARLRKRPSQPLVCEALEDRCLPAFSVIGSGVHGTSALRLVVDLNQAVNSATVQPGDLQVDGTQPAVSVNVVDADTVEFLLPALGAGSHAAAIAADALRDTLGTGIDPFNTSFVIASAAQLTVKHNPRLQPGNAPLAGYPGSELDRVDILWQTIPGGAGTQDSFTVEYRAGGAASWQTAMLNTPIDTGIEGRVVRSASITGLSWNSDYEYRVRHRRADVIVGEYQNTFRTRLAAGDPTPFTFAAYGDSASGTAAGFRQVQARINAVNPAFAVLLGDNVYTAGSHPESDARFDPVVNPEAAAWMAGHIDYLGLGNHDVGTSSGLPSEQNFSVPIPVAGVTALAAPPASERPEHSFSWDYGSVHFLTFDTNSLSDTARLNGLLNWAVADLNATTARWKIVYGHHPVGGVPDKPEGAGDNYYQQVVSRLKAAGVDLFMVGHSHTYSWTYPLTGQVNDTATFVNHGVNDYFHAGEGLPQLVAGAGGVDLRPGDYSSIPFVAAGFTETTPIPARFGFSQISVTPNQLTVSYVAADDGSIIDSFLIEKDVNLQTVSFQQGVNGYSGTVDTFLHQNTPTANNAAATSLSVDGDDPSGTGFDAQTLLRFDNLFGSGAGQIPANATLRTATLQLQVTNGSVNNMNLHRMLAAWSATDTWNSRGAGVQTDGVEAVATPDTSSGESQAGLLSFNVLPSVQAWLANPTTNRGWVIVPTGTDGVDFHSSEGVVKPRLIVTYVIDTGPNSPPVAQTDTATTAGNTPAMIGVLNNDTDPNGDALSVASVTQPAHGIVVINAGNTVTYTPANSYFGLDSFSYTISDGRGGTATGTVNMIVGQTVVFQQGVNGYTGTVDTFLQQNVPTASNGAATSLNIDSDDPSGSGLDVQALLRFDNLFGTGAGQIPTNATLYSATLQLQVTNSGNSMNLHRMRINWTASDTWDTLGGGVQNNGLEALAAADVSTGAVAAGPLAIHVLSSLLAWQGAPTSNLGWVFLPTGADGVDVNSSEGATKPTLTVVYFPANTPPTISDVANQVTNEGTPTAALAFTVGDAETTPTSLVVTAASSNAALLPNANLVLGGSGANRTLTATPLAGQTGATTITLTVSDGTLTASDTFVLTVTPFRLLVTELTPTSTGFTALFNGDLDASVLNLYDTQSAGLSPADAQLASTGVPVRGSLVLDAVGRRITFVRTGGPLPAGSYTVTLRSLADGFRSTSGALLDGNNDGVTGDAFSAPLTITSSSRHVSVPDFARGPGQAVDVPATADSDLPLTLSDGTGVTLIRLDLRYDPELLTLTGFVPGPGIAPSAVTFDTSVTGLARLTINASLNAGPVTLVRLLAQVPNDAPYGSKQVLDLDAIEINGSPVTNADDDGIHVVAYPGDVSGNAAYSAADATRALRAAVGLDSGFVAFQFADPALIVGSSRVTASDATRILQEAIGLDRPEIPPLPGVLPPIIPGGPDPRLSLPTTLRGRPGDTVIVPVNLDLSDGLENADLALSYDVRRLEVLAADAIQRGSLTADFDVFAVNLDPAAGTIRVGLGRSTGPIVGRGSGSVLRIAFRIRPDARTGGAVLNLRQALEETRTQLNEGGLDLAPDPSDEPGDALDGRILVLGVQARRAAFAGQPADVLRLLTPGSAVRPHAEPSLDMPGPAAAGQRALPETSAAEGYRVRTVKGDDNRDGFSTAALDSDAVEAFFRRYTDRDDLDLLAFLRSSPQQTRLPVQ